MKKSNYIKILLKEQKREFTKKQKIDFKKHFDNKIFKVYFGESYNCKTFEFNGKIDFRSAYFDGENRVYLILAREYLN